MTASEGDGVAMADDAEQTLADKIALRCRLEMGYVRCEDADAAPLAARFDELLVADDGLTRSFVGLVDGDRHPGKQFTTSLYELQLLADDLRRGSHPVRVHVVEVGPTALDERAASLAPFRRAHIFDRRFLSASVVESTTGRVWANNKIWQRFLTRAVAAAPLTEAEIEARRHVAMPSPRPPWATYGLMAVLVAVFVVQIWLDPARRIFTGFDGATLAAMGGSARMLVVESGQWLRLLTAAFLHLSLIHLAFNLIALYIGGKALERVVGGVWTLAIYVIGAIGASLISMVFNPPNVVGVGASGAIMAEAGSLVVMAFRFPPGPVRSRMMTGSLYMLVPTLMTGNQARDGSIVDFAAHLGGALTGIAFAALMLRFWSRDEPLPPMRRAAIGVVAAALAVVVIGAPSLQREYRAVMLVRALAPNTILPTLRLDAYAGGERFTTEYPRDPRGHIYVGDYLVEQKRFAEAEREARKALALDDVYAAFEAPKELHTAAEALLVAVLIAQGRRDQIAPYLPDICGSPNIGPKARAEGLCN